jgi:hypothetical protein
MKAMRRALGSFIDKSIENTSSEMSSPARSLANIV